MLACFCSHCNPLKLGGGAFDEEEKGETAKTAFSNRDLWRELRKLRDYEGSWLTLSLAEISLRVPKLLTAPSPVNDFGVDRSWLLPMPLLPLQESLRPLSLFDTDA